jgi:quercetin dioxygenase-like cupin family protein
LERFSFGPDVAFRPNEELLENVTVAPLTARMESGVPFKAAIFRLTANGRIRRHPATYPQILAVLEGSGTVSGGTGVPEPIQPGEAVVWEEGEEHETVSEGGMTALVLEAHGLLPWRIGDELRARVG